MPNERNVEFFALESGFLGKNDPIRKRNAKPLRDGADAYSGNVFYYWFQFLKLHQEFVGVPKNGPSVATVTSIYDEFDVGHYDDFYVWWRTHGRKIFGGSSEDSPKAEVPLTAEEFAEKKDGIGIFFPFDGDIAAMLVQAEKHFRAAKTAFYEREPDQKPSHELHSRRYDCVSLYNKLVVYRAVMSAKDTPFLKIFDGIADKLDLSMMERRRKPKPGEDAKTGPNFAATLEPEEITKWMSDNFDQACRVVYHVARGEFPKFKKPEGPYNPRKTAAGGY